MPGRPAHCRRLQRRTNRRHVAGGPPSTSENASVEPGDLNASGNTTFSVHVVYFAATTADQYHGTATVVTDDGGPPPPPPPVRSTEWNIRYHGTCCERNLSTSGGDTYPLLPVLVQGNKSRKNSDGRRTWAEIYPPAPASFPTGSKATCRHLATMSFSSKLSSRRLSSRTINSSDIGLIKSKSGNMLSTPEAREEQQ
jgi:hypothetical protein